MPAQLTPAAQLARARTPFPGASPEYDRTRVALLAEEIEFRRHMTRLTEQRRALPPGPAITKNYQFKLIARPCRRLLVWGAGVCLSLSLGAAQAADGLTVTGDVKHAMTLDVAALRAFPAAAHTTYRYARFARDASDRQRPFTELRGVRLMDVLEQAGLADRDRSDWRKAVVIATGRDGSRTVFSWPELAYTAAGTEAMVAYELDVAPLPASDGPLAIHVPGDERRVARDVKQVQRIEVRILRD